MPLSYPYKQNEEDKEIPTLSFFDQSLTPFEQLPDDDDDNQSPLTDDSDLPISNTPSQNGKQPQ